jgi:hypothetical protein
MPITRFELQPAAVIECPFLITWDRDPGANSVSGYVQTSFGRATAASAPIPYDYSNCGSGSGDGNTAAMCTVQEQGACVSVTDGSYIVNK